MLTVDRALVRQAFDDKELVEINGFQFLINPLTEQIPATTAELLRESARWIIEAGSFAGATKIAGEEDKGAIIVAAVSLLSGLPFGMARWYPSGLEGQVKAEFQCEYTTGTIYLNGIEKGDKVIVVDDLISTGGTMVALLAAVKAVGAEVVDVVCVGEKVEYGGVQRVKAETGLDIKTLVKIAVSGRRSKVLE